MIEKNKTMKSKWVILAIILFLGVALRWGRLGNFPPALNWDEVSHGYNAFSLLTTGKDEWGEAFPLFNFRAYGDYPCSLNLYLTIPFIFLFGLSEMSIRLPHMILGVLTVGASFWLVWGLSKKTSLSLLVGLLVAIGPWYVFPSHYVSQANLSVFFLILGMALFFNRQASKWFLPLGIISLILTLFSYHTTRIFAPLLVMALVWIYRYEWRECFNSRNRLKWLTVGLFLGFWVVVAAVFVDPGARARSQWVFLIDEGAVNQIVEARQTTNLPVVLSRLVYNRPIYFITHFAQNYAGYFSPVFLFFEGERIISSACRVWGYCTRSIWWCFMWGF